MKKNVLILTASYGSGHNAAAKGLNKSFKDLYSTEIEAEILDLVKVGNPYSTKLWQVLYETAMMKCIKFWDRLLRFTNTFRGMTRFFDKISHSSYGDLTLSLDKYKPDIFVSVHPYWTPFIKKYNEKFNKNLKLVEVITDSIAIHCSWYLQFPDYYIVPNEETKNELIKEGRVPEGIIKVFGFPVNTLLGQPLYKAKLISELGLENSRVTFLVNFGLGQISNIRKMFEYLIIQKNANIQVIVICGKREDLFKELSSRQYEIPIKIIGWTDKMYDFIRVSDVLVSKSGGAIVMESLAAGKPILNPEFSPFQEQGNSFLLKKYNAGYLESDITKMMVFLKNIIENPTKITALQSGAREIGNPKSADNITKFVYDLITKSVE